MRTIIVGLGNPGSRYDGTRHNIGFAVVDELARRAGANWREKPAWNAEIAEYG
jgi:PTH1 family peptidyl-tRNA hydrolase